MDGSYQNPYNRGNTGSPMSPDTPQGAAYRKNINRTKTRKWVEAKSQNYDGDDWGGGGDEYGDEEPDPEPVPAMPPSRSDGSRQPSAASTQSRAIPQIPSATHESQSQSQSQFQPYQARASASGRPPSLHIQTQDLQATPAAPIVPDEAQEQTGNRRSATDRVTSPQSAAAATAAPAGAPAAFRGASNSPPPPVSAPVTAPAPSRFPPRKSSVGQQDVEATQSPSSESIQRPWVEQRSGSPASVQSRDTPGKPLPFVRPSDIYRRMEAERASMDSARQSVDENAGRAGARAESPAVAGSTEQALPVEQQQPPQESEPEEQDQDANLGNRADPHSLANVAESRSEYGPGSVSAQPYEQPQRDQPQDVAPANFPSDISKETSESTGRSVELNVIAAAAAAAEQPSQQSVEQPVEQPADQSVKQSVTGAADSEYIDDPPRRLSTSPQLPDLARMSMFGVDDFFTSSQHRFSRSGPPEQSIQEDTQDMPAPGSASPSHQITTGQPATADQEDVSASQDTSDVARKTSTTSVDDRANTGLGVEVPPSQDENYEPGPVVAPEVPRASFAGDEGQRSLPAEEPSDTPKAVPTQLNPADAGEISSISDNAQESSRRIGAPGFVATGASATAAAASQQPEACGVSGSPGTPQASGPEGDDAQAAVPSQIEPSHDAQDDFSHPTPLQREDTMSTLAAPSPIKESDKLREEIIRTLSPVGPTGAPNSSAEAKDHGPPPNAANRGSTYLQGVYDDYWSGNEDKQAQLPGQPSESLANNQQAAMSGISPLSPRRDAAEKPDGPRPEARPRRFSWEAEPEISQPAAVPQDTAGHSEPATFVANTVDASRPTLDYPQSEQGPPRQTADELPSTEADKDRVNVPNVLESDAIMPNQVSQVTSIPDESPGPVARGRPSMASAASDESFDRLKRMSLADEKALATSSENLATSEPPPELHPALAQREESPPPVEAAETPQQPPTQTSQNIMSFREILDLSSASDRINKYNETRQQFATMESGLSNWMASLKTQTPEHANASPSYYTMITTAGPSDIASDGQGLPQRSPTGAQPASQQPYYQQYLNASSPNPAAGPGRSPSGTPVGSHSAASDFKHSGGQVGAKSKEFLLAAGKAGKGLLSKGKNKIRGEKNEESSSPTPPSSKAKNEHRSSWGLNFGARSSPRGGAEDPRSQQDPTAAEGSAPQPSRVSPFETPPNGKQSSAWPPPQDNVAEPVSPVSEARSVKEGDNSGRLQIPRPISKVQPTWDPTTATPLVEEEGFELDQSRPPSSTPRDAVPTQQLLREMITEDDRSDDWVVVEPQNANEPYRMVPSEAKQQSAPVSQTPDATPEPTNGASAGSTGPDGAKRNSSFIGLPPIRRGSTFGFPYTRRAKERFSLDDDDETEERPSPDVRAAHPEVTGPSQESERQSSQNNTVANSWANTDVAPGSQGRVGTREAYLGDTLGASTLDHRSSMESSEISVGEDPEKTPLPAPASNVPQHRQTQQPPRPPRPQPAIGALPPGGNPIQHLPPQGWKLEEAHLSEPLATSRNRQHNMGTPPLNYSHFSSDREASAPQKGEPLTQPRASAMMPPRQKVSETPPSSARRYPGLFSRAAGQQPMPQGEPQGFQDPTLGHDPRSQSGDEVMIQRSQRGEISREGMNRSSMDEERGRSRHMAFLSNIGGRIRSASRGRRNSTAETPASASGGNGPSGLGTGVASDERPTADAAEEHKPRRRTRRSSFFANLRGAKGGDEKDQEDSANDDANDALDPPQPAFAQAEPSPQQRFSQERRRSFFGVGGRGSSTGPSPGLSRASTSGNFDEVQGDERQPFKSAKKRISAITGKILHRPSGNRDEAFKDTTTAQSETPSLQSRNSGLPDARAEGPGPQGNEGRQRSGTTGSMQATDREPVNTSQVGVADNERGRRGSVSEFLSGFFNRSASKNRDSPSQPQEPPPPPQQQQRRRQQQHPLRQHAPEQAEQQREQRMSSCEVEMGRPPPFEPIPPNVAPQLGQHPPPFRTQGPPVHPVAGVSPPNRNQPSFPDPENPPEDYHVSVRPVESETESDLDPTPRNSLQQQGDALLTALSYPPRTTPQQAPRQTVNISQQFQTPPSSAPEPEAGQVSSQSSFREPAQQRSPSRDVEATVLPVQQPPSPTDRIGKSNDRNLAADPRNALNLDDSRAGQDHIGPEPEQSQPSSVQAFGSHPDIAMNNPEIAVQGMNAVSGHPNRPMHPQYQASAQDQPSANMQAVESRPPMNPEFQHKEAWAPSEGRDPRATTGPAQAPSAPSSMHLSNPPYDHERLPQQSSEHIPLDHRYHHHHYQQQPPPPQYWPQPRGPVSSTGPQGPHNQQIIHAPVQNQQATAVAPASHESHSIVRKWLKGRSSDQDSGQAHGNQKESEKKESTTKALLNAFKRSSKQPGETRQSQQNDEEQPPNHTPPAQSHQQMMHSQPGPSSQARNDLAAMQGLPPPQPHWMAQQNQTQSPSQRFSPPQISNQGQMPPLMQPQPRSPNRQSALASHSPQQRQRSSSGGPPGPGQGASHPHQFAGQGQGQLDFRGRRPPAGYPMPGSRRPPPGWSSKAEHGFDQPQPQPFEEPQYDAVPIPKSYARVQGEGVTANAPSRVGGGSRALSQQMQSQVYDCRQWGQRHVSMGSQNQLHAQISPDQRPQRFSAPAQRSNPPQGSMASQRPESYQQHPALRDSFQRQLGEEARHVQRPEGKDPGSFSYVEHQQPRYSDPQQLPQSHSSPSKPLTVDDTADRPSMQASRTRKNKTPDPWAPAVLDLNVDTQEASQIRDNNEDDDLYDATPRTHSTVLQSARTGDSQNSLDSRNILAPRQNTNGSVSGGAGIGREGNTRAELEDTEEKRKVSMRREAQEEKILYDPNEDGPTHLSGNMKTGDVDGNDPRNGAPHMSATSYPGMEWNPYASRPYEDWNE